MERKRILVTGGAGFISSNMIRYLLGDTEHEVVTMDALTYAGNLANLDDVIDHDRLRFIKGDIRDVRDVSEALDGVDVIVNAAAESHVSKSIEEGGSEFVTTNVVGTQVLLDAMREHPVERFILISSSEVYGTAESEPMTEDHPLNPRSPYAGTKAGGDRLAYSYWCTYDLPVTIIRPFNNYGPYQHPEKVIPRFIIQALTDQPLTIHGGGTASRDWLHVFDTAEAITRACEVPLENIVGETINVATGIDESVEQIADMILDLAGQARQPQAPRRRPAGPGRHPHRLDRPCGELLGWRSSISFEDGLERTIAWYRDNPAWWTAVLAGETDRADGLTLVVLGGGPAQRHAIDAAQALGVRTVVCDANPARGDVAVSSEDVEGVLRTARDAGARGLIAPGTDWPVRVAAEVAEELDLPHPLDLATAQIATDKLAQRERLAAAGVPQPAWSLAGAALVPGRRQGGRPPGPAGDEHRRARRRARRG